MDTNMNNFTLHDWKQKAINLKVVNQAFIGGVFCDSESRNVYEKSIPYNQKEKISITRCNHLDVEKAVFEARKSFSQGEWRLLPAKERKKKLLQLVALMEKHKGEIALLDSMDMGKPISYSLNEDTKSGIDHFQWMAESIDKIYDEITPSNHDFIGLLRRQPVGVVAAIIPWNYPFMMMSWKIAPALAAGNSVILKPSEKSPLTALFIASLWEKLDLPKGVFNVLPGSGEEVGAPLSQHMDVNALVFTGSTQTAKKLLIASGKSNMKRVWLEAGGKCPTIILPNANIEKAVKAIATSIFYNQGEVCIAGSRLIVDKKTKEKLLPYLIEEAKKWFPNHPLNPQGNMGAIVDKLQYDKINDYIEIGKKHAKLLEIDYQNDFQKSNEYKQGFYIPPKIFDEVDNSMQIAQEEIFGPVLSIITPKDKQDLIEVANDTQYGLGASIWTEDIMLAEKMATAIDAGSVWINCWGDGDATMPFGGMKQSGYGRDKSFHAFEKYTDIKAIIIGK